MNTIKEMSAKLDECLVQVARLLEDLVEARKQRDEAVAELAHVREQLGTTLCVIEHAATAAAEVEERCQTCERFANDDEAATFVREVLASSCSLLSSSILDARAGDMLVVRIDELDAEAIRTGADQITVMRSDFMGFIDTIERSHERDLAAENT